MPSLASFQEPGLQVRLEAALRSFARLPNEVEGLGPLHHVGFIATQDLSLLGKRGFHLTEMYESQRVARELGTPTMVRRYQRGLACIEVFVPTASSHRVAQWIQEGRALHLAFEVENLAVAPYGWVPQGEPTEVQGCRILYYSQAQISYRLELFQRIPGGVTTH